MRLNALILLSLFLLQGCATKILGRGEKTKGNILETPKLHSVPNRPCPIDIQARQRTQQKMIEDQNRDLQSIKSE